MQTFSTPCIRNTHQPEWEIPDGGSGVVPTPTFKSLQCLLSHGRLHRKWNQSAVQPARQPTLVQNRGDGSLDLLRDNMAEVMRPEVNETATAKGSSGFVQKNPFKIHKPSQYGMEKQHKGAKLFRTSSKGVQHLRSWWPTHCISQNWLRVHSSWLRTANLFFVKQLFSLGKCSFWLISS